MRTRAIWMLALLAVALPLPAAAHEGHGPETTWAGLVHWLSSPVHLVSVVVAAAVLLTVVGVAVMRRAPALRASEEPGA